jgi:hypothetical protein
MLGRFEAMRADPLNLAGGIGRDDLHRREFHGGIRGSSAECGQSESEYCDFRVCHFLPFIGVTRRETTLTAHEEEDFVRC